MIPAIPLAAQIDEVNRTLGFRQATNPGKVAGGQLPKIVSEQQIARTEAALKTLRFVRDNREKIEAATGVKLP